ncbi:Uncharacterised protein [Chromobacterium violaceum]|nr:Uncharacterised protein [Chromobacterium violaceum]
MFAFFVRNAAVKKTSVLFFLLLLILSGCSDKDKLAQLEAENQQLKARIQLMESEHPIINHAPLQTFGKERLGRDLPDIDRVGFLTARAALAGVNAIHDEMGKIQSPSEIKEKVLYPLHTLEDMWPAHRSEAGEKIDPIFHSCQNMVTLTRMGVEAAQANMDAVLPKISDLEKLVRFQCSFALSAAVIKSQEKK